MTPRAYTEDEVRDKFLKHVAHMIEYWNSENGSNVPADESSRGRLEGLVHSLLATIDGCSMALPAFILSPSPHSEDKQYRIDEGEEFYYPEEGEVDISGGLHELMYGAIKGE